MEDNKHEGWSNRETWALNLWLSNDEGFYDHLREIIKEMAQSHENEECKVTADDRDKIIHDFAVWLKDYIEQLKEECDNMNHEEACKHHYNGCLHTFFDDIGSLWRIDYEEIAEPWVQDTIDDYEDDNKA